MTMELSRIKPCVLLHILLFLALEMRTKQTEAIVLPYMLPAENSTTMVIKPAVPDSVAKSLASQHETGGTAKSLANAYRVRSLVTHSVKQIFAKLTSLSATHRIPKRSIASEYAEFLQKEANPSTWSIWKTTQLQSMYNAMFSKRTTTNEEQSRTNNTVDEFPQLSKRNRIVRPEVSETTTAHSEFKEMSPDAEALIRGIKQEAQENDQDHVTDTLGSPEDESRDTSDTSQLSAELQQSEFTKSNTSHESSVAAAGQPQPSQDEPNGVEGEDSAQSTETEDRPTEVHAATEDQNSEQEDAIAVQLNPSGQEETDATQTDSDGEEATSSMSTTAEDSAGNESQSVVNNRTTPGKPQETDSGPESETSLNTDGMKNDLNAGNKSPEPRVGGLPLSKGYSDSEGNDQKITGAAENAAETGEQKVLSSSKGASPENEQQTTGAVQGEAVSGASEPNEPEDNLKQSGDDPGNEPEQATDQSSTDPGEPPVQNDMSVKSQVAKSGTYRGSKSGIVKGENTTQLSLMVYKVAKSEKIRSMAAAPCRAVSHWMPEVVLRLEFEVPGFQFYCVDTEEPPGSMKDLKQAFGEISGGFLQASPDDVGQAVPKNVELVVSWMGIQQWGIRKSWRFIKGLRRSGVRMALFSNNPMSSNVGLSVSVGTLNIRKSPLLFNEPSRVFGKVSTDDNKQLLLYSMDGLREGF